jgi:hypothetical protein
MISSTVNRDCRMKVSPAFEASHYNSLIFGEHLISTLVHKYRNLLLNSCDYFPLTLPSPPLGERGKEETALRLCHQKKLDDLAYSLSPRCRGRGGDA